MSTLKPCRQQSRFLAAFLLLLLAEKPQHGGALRAELATVPGMRADSAAIYRALTALAKAGEVRSKWKAEGRGPAVRIYALTAAGRKRLNFWRRDVVCRLATLQYFVDACGRLKRPKGGTPAR
jgi:PadR family transcriptional regulator, regulatory protein PadR